MVTDTIRMIFELADFLEQQYPGRHFTPDGHMLGSIGEVYAAERYGVELYIASHEVHDGITADGREVQIKITQGDRVGLSSKPEFLIVLKIDRLGTITEVYNGPGEAPWSHAGKMQKNGQRMISVGKLKALNAEVKERIMPCHETINH